MKYTKILQGLVVAGGLALSGAALAGTPSGEMLGDACAGCHGTDGASHGPATPSIAGISSEYFIEAMKAYKAGERPATIMNRIAKGYTDDEIKAMAGFFAEQTFASGPQTIDERMAKQGKALHDRACEKCHSDNGRSTEDDAGILAGQWKDYLLYTLADFRSGKRDMPKKMAKRLEVLDMRYGDDGIKQLVEFYASQR